MGVTDARISVARRTGEAGYPLLDESRVRTRGGWLMVTCNELANMKIGEGASAFSPCGWILFSLSGQVSRLAPLLRECRPFGEDRGRYPINHGVRCLGGKSKQGRPHAAI